MSYYLVQTKTKSEAKVKHRLQRDGFETFLPVFNNEPLFPGYLFVNGCYDNGTDLDLHPVKKTPDVIKIVGFPEPLPVRDELINKMRGITWELPEEYAEGSTVTITEGPFIHHKAIVKARKGDRIILLLNIINQEQELEFATKVVAA